MPTPPDPPVVIDDTVYISDANGGDRIAWLDVDEWEAMK